MFTDMLSNYQGTIYRKFESRAKHNNFNDKKQKFLDKLEFQIHRGTIQRLDYLEEILAYGNDEQETSNNRRNLLRFLKKCKFHIFFVSQIGLHFFSC